MSKTVIYCLYWSFFFRQCFSLFASLGISITSITTSTSHHGSSSAPPVEPAEWPSFFSDLVRTKQLIRGPLPIKENFTFPKRYDGRSFHYHHTHRQLLNGEKVRRSWLTYSRSKDAVYCFCCKLFSKKSLKQATNGQLDGLCQHRRTPQTAKKSPLENNQILMGVHSLQRWRTFQNSLMHR